MHFGVLLPLLYLEHWFYSKPARVVRGVERYSDGARSLLSCLLRFTNSCQASSIFTSLVELETNTSPIFHNMWWRETFVVTSGSLSRFVTRLLRWISSPYPNSRASKCFLPTSELHLTRICEQCISPQDPPPRNRSMHSTHFDPSLTGCVRVVYITSFAR